MWEDAENSDYEPDDGLNELPPTLPEDVAMTKNPIVVWLVGFLLILQAKYYIPDACMNALLKFLCVLFKLLGLTSASISSMAAAIPTSVYKLQRYTGCSNYFTSYVVCPKCHYLYKYNDNNSTLIEFFYD